MRGSHFRSEQPSEGRKKEARQCTDCLAPARSGATAAGEPGGPEEPLLLPPSPPHAPAEAAASTDQAILETFTRMLTQHDSAAPAPGRENLPCCCYGNMVWGNQRPSIHLAASLLCARGSCESANNFPLLIEMGIAYPSVGGKALRGCAVPLQQQKYKPQLRRHNQEGPLAQSHLPNLQWWGHEGKVLLSR